VPCVSPVGENISHAAPVQIPRPAGSTGPRPPDARQRILVTGSARLDFYRFGGDSLQGRYHLLRLHPLSVAELGISSAADWRALRVLGGFPEPFFGGSARDARRWSTEHRNLLIREELVSLERDWTLPPSPRRGVREPGGRPSAEMGALPAGCRRAGRAWSLDRTSRRPSPWS